MMNVRTYGQSEIDIVVLHGGPGAPGYMAPVARELGKKFGVLEPLQTMSSLKAQIKELDEQITKYCNKPICLIGSSWGATLALLYASEYTDKVSKIILIGSCVYDAKTSKDVNAIRLNRMSEDTKTRFNDLSDKMKQCSDKDKNLFFQKLADCFFESDTFDPITKNLEIIACQHDINKTVWNDFKNIRDTPNALANIFSKIKIPVVNIHGEYDPHLIEGIQPFLTSCIDNITLNILKKCGHYPWIERHAKEKFYKLIDNEIKNTSN